MLIKDATAIAGPLGYPSKMPGTALGLSAHACITGSKLAAVPGSVCYDCYALKGNYTFPSVAMAHEKRMAGISHPAWSIALATLIGNEYRKACQEFIALIRKPAMLARLIKRDRSNHTGFQSPTQGVGSGLARSIATGTGTIPRRAAASRATYLLTLPLTGGTVALSRKAFKHITNVKRDPVLTRTISQFCQSVNTSDCMRASAEILAPAGLRIDYYFRFHDSGDIQSEAHLAKMATVAVLLPMVRFWVPTREMAILARYVKQGGTVPENLLVRVSATMVDGPATSAWPTTSGVCDKLAPTGYECPAPQQDGHCGPCRACWLPSVPHTVYHKH